MRRRRVRPGVVFALTTAALAAGACGPPPPQAPFPQAKKLDASTGSISTACGEASQVTAFPADHRSELTTLNVTATSAGKKLASVYRRNPGWIYQGDTVRQIVHDSLQMLDSCGLHAAEAALRKDTAQ